MVFNIIGYLSTSGKSTNTEYWQGLLDYGTSKTYLRGSSNAATNNSNILSGVLSLVQEIDLSSYAPTIFIVGHKYIVRLLTKISGGCELHNLQTKPLRNIEQWKELSSLNLSSISWESVREATSLAGTREVAQLVKDAQ